MTSLRHERGAEWSIWDLHVHTPCSIEHGYGNSETAWPRFIEEIEGLPKEIKVIAVSDYWFLDGFRKLAEARAEGRMANLAAIFPAIEMRLQDFAGTDGGLRRINAHVVFDPSTSAEFIEQQFVSALAPSFDLLPGQGGTWNKTITRSSVEDFGSSIIESVPASEKSSFGSPLQEGFNNLVVPFRQVQDILDRPALKDCALLIIGKAEWASYKWNEQSIASKKNLINSAKAIFTAFEDSSTWQTQVDKLRDANVNHRILDCSDAHYWSDSSEKDRLGNCHTWMKTVPTLAGLRHALDEFESRVHVGRLPQEISHTQTRPGSYLQTISIRPADPNSGTVFDYTLPINPGFVAILGNKGQGKSALLDCIALAGNSHRSDDFAFLNESRFLNGNTSASSYISTVQWLDGTAEARSLEAGCVAERPAKVEYLPQSYVEKICNARPGSDEAARFESELREVLFTHIPVQGRAGAVSFDQLLEAKRAATQSKIRELERSIEPLIAEAFDLAEFQQTQRREELDARLEGLLAQLAQAESALASARSDLQKVSEESANSETLNALALEISRLEAELSSLALQNQATASKLGYLDRVQLEVAATRAMAHSLQSQADAINTSLSAACKDAGLLGLPSEYVQVLVDDARLDQVLADVNTVAQDQRRMDTASSERESTLRRELDSLQNQSARLDATAERARQLVVDTEARVQGLRGAPDDINSIEGTKNLITRLDDSPAKVAALKGRILEACRSIYEAIQSEREELAVLYKPATDFMERHPELLATGLEVSTSLEVSPRLWQIRESLDGRKASEMLRRLDALPRTVDLDEWPSVERAVEAFLDFALADASGYPLKSGYSLSQVTADFLTLRWTTLKFGLTGEGRPLAELSPGQRGLILVLFYLLLDRRTSPLLLDQPEENLDNETVSAVLVPAIKDAVRRRQLLIVTHNANLAVVGDADQVVYCKHAEDRFLVTAGALDDLTTARHAVDVLEGTKRALTNRWHKFEALPPA